MVNVQLAASLDDLGFVAVLLAQGLEELPLVPPTTSLAPQTETEDGS